MGRLSVGLRSRSWHWLLLPCTLHDVAWCQRGNALAPHNDGSVTNVNGLL